jgi:hypothetical protein
MEVLKEAAVCGSEALEEGGSVGETEKQALGSGLGGDH